MSSSASGILIRNHDDPVYNAFPFDATERAEGVVLRALRSYYSKRDVRSVDVTSLEALHDRLTFRAVVTCANDDVLHDTGHAHLVNHFYREYGSRELRLHVGLTVYLDETVHDRVTLLVPLGAP